MIYPFAAVQPGWLHTSESHISPAAFCRSIDDSISCVSIAAFTPIQCNLSASQVTHRNDWCEPNAHIRVHPGLYSAGTFKLIKLASSPYRSSFALIVFNKLSTTSAWENIKSSKIRSCFCLHHDRCVEPDCIMYWEEFVITGITLRKPDRRLKTRIKRDDKTRILKLMKNKQRNSESFIKLSIKNNCENCQSDTDGPNGSKNNDRQNKT